MQAYKNTPLAFLIGVLVVFLYLLIAPAAGMLPSATPSLFAALFNYVLPGEAVFTIFLRSLLVFAAGFSLAWLAFSLRSKPNN